MAAEPKPLAATPDGGLLLHAVHCLVGLALAAVVWCIVGARVAAALLELLGLGTVALGIGELRHSFGLPSFAHQLASHAQAAFSLVRRAVRRAMGHKEGTVVITGTGAVSVAGHAGEGTGSVGLPTDASLEERLAFLERWTAQAISALQTQLSDEVRDRLDAVAAEGREREEAERRLTEKLAGVAVGGIDLEVVGLIWLAAGIILAAAAPG